MTTTLKSEKVLTAAKQTSTPTPPQEGAITTSDNTTPTPKNQSLNTPNIWPEVQLTLRRQMTQATYDAVIQRTFVHDVDGNKWTIGTPTEMAKEWLENRLLDVVRRALASVTDTPESAITIEFVILEPPSADQDYLHAHADNSINNPDSDNYLHAHADNSIVSTAANANYIDVFYSPRGSGYSQIAHYVTYFWMMLMDSAFSLWKFLDSEDKRTLKKIAPNFWSTPRSYTYDDLAGRLNRKHPQCIYGYPEECRNSRTRRLDQHNPVQTQNDCCGGDAWEYLRLQSAPGSNGTTAKMCQHWHEGRLETLIRYGLARAELNGPTGRKPTLQVWRVPPVMTPHLVSQLSPQLQQEHDTWLDTYGHLIGLDRAAWLEIDVPNLLPLMPEYATNDIENNFMERRARAEFFNSAFANPRYNTENNTT